MRLFLKASLLIWMSAATAQDLMIENARIITGTGEVIDNGHIAIRSGLIASIAGGEAPSTDLQVLDAGGQTAIPGLINTHWHLTVGAPSTGDAELQEFADTVIRAELDSLIDRGVTTIMSVGDHFPNIVSLRERLAAGDPPTPRLLIAGPVLTSPADWPTQICGGNAFCLERLSVELNSEPAARAAVRKLADAGVDAIKLVYDDTITPGVRIDDALVAVIAEEASKHGLTLYAHVSTAEETGLRVVELGAGRLVHPVSLRSAASLGGADKLRNLGVAVSTTVAAMSPEWSEVIGREHSEELQAAYLGRLDDIRHLHDNSVIVAFGTDSVAGPGSMSDRFFLTEVNSLASIMSNEDVLAALTRDAATYLELDDVGTLQPGKRADIVILGGDPLAEIANVTSTRIVIQDGLVVADHRR